MLAVSETYFMLISSSEREILFVSFVVVVIKKEFLLKKNKNTFWLWGSGKDKIFKLTSFIHTSKGNHNYL